MFADLRLTDFSPIYLHTDACEYTCSVYISCGRFMTLTMSNNKLFIDKYMYINSHSWMNEWTNVEEWFASSASVVNNIDGALFLSFSPLIFCFSSSLSLLCCAVCVFFRASLLFNDEVKSRIYEYRWSKYWLITKYQVLSTFFSLAMRA